MSFEASSCFDFSGQLVSNRISFIIKIHWRFLIDLEHQMFARELLEAEMPHETADFDP